MCVRCEQIVSCSQSFSLSSICSSFSSLCPLIFLRLSLLSSDVKPSNVLINRKGEIKLCDFGIAGKLDNSYCVSEVGCMLYLAVSEESQRVYRLYTLYMLVLSMVRVN